MARFEAHDIQSFGGWIENRRRAMNLTRNELAEQVGCAAVTIKKIERDERKPSRQMAELLAEHLAIPPADRNAFLQMARGFRGDPAAPSQPLLRIPHFLEQEGPGPSRSAIDFVERGLELSRLETCLDQALAGKAVPIFLLGEAGSGKTTLMREFARRAQEAHPKLLVAGGQCNAQTGQGDAFRPFRDILGILTGDLEIDWTVEMLNQQQALQIWASIPDVLQAIADFGPHLLDHLLPVTPLLRRISAHLAGNADWFDHFRASVHDVTSKHSDLERGQVSDELTQVFRAVAGGHPLLLILDDLQWADNASLNVLFHLCRRLAGSRVLIVGAYRTGETPMLPSSEPPAAEQIDSTKSLILELARQYGDIQIRLDQESESEGRAFIDAVLDQEPNRLGESFREDLYLHTRGHPLFTVEILQSMRQNQNLLLDETGYWVENKSAPPYQRPARVEAVIERRLARLNPMERQLLEVASVEGEVFFAQIVAEALQADLRQTLKALVHDLGQNHHLVQELGTLSVRSLRLSRFQFHHMLVQEHLYGGLDPAEKRRLHHQIADELEKSLLETQDASETGERAVQSETLDEFGPTLLHHFASGEEWAKAATYAYELGDRARQKYAMREAIAYFEQALHALDQVAEPKQDLMFDVLLGWEDAAFGFTPYKEQLAQLSRAENIARILNDKPRLIQALHSTASVLVARGLWTRAGAALQESLTLAEEMGDERLAARPLFFKALMTSFADPAHALQWTARAGELSRKYEDSKLEALVCGIEGHLFAQLGAFERSRQALSNARQISDHVESPLLKSDVDLFSAWAWLSMGNLEQAMEFGEQSVQRAIATENMDCICSGMVCIGYINLELGRISDAAAAFDKGIERSEVSGAIVHQQNGQAGLAMTRFIGGQPDAIQDLERIIADMRLIDNHVGAAGASYLLGNCLIQLGKFEQALNALNDAVDFYRHSQMLPFLARALESVAALMDIEGRTAEAQEHRSEAESLRALSGTAH
jgi:tetratricopeptide (TPR) repeat protein/transcriptional regulator with XRE-family HTH domain